MCARSRCVFTQGLYGCFEICSPDRRLHPHAFAHNVDSPRTVFSPEPTCHSRCKSDVFFPFLSILYLALYRVYIPHWLVLLCIPASHVTLSIPQRRSFFWVPSLISLAEALGKELFRGGYSRMKASQQSSFFFFNIFFRLFLGGPFLKSLVNLLQYCFCFMFWAWGALRHMGC